MFENSILLWTLIGCISETVLSLTGTGGSVISIPLLMSWGGYDIKAATAYALLSLAVGSAISWAVQRKNTLYPVGGVLIIFAGISAYLSIPLKTLSPPWVIIGLINLTCVVSLYGLWFLPKSENPKNSIPLSSRLKTAPIGGVIMGFLNTMTGLGGGVVIIPWLTSITGLTFKQAIACSLLTIAVIAPFSAWRQGEVNLSLGEWLGLVTGVLFMAILVRKVTSYIPPQKMVLVNKVSLTSITILSMYKTLVHLF